MSDQRDPLDDALGDGLRALAPSEFELDADSALGSMRPALQRARSRRRLAMTTSVLGLCVVVAGGAALLQRQPNSQIDIQGPSRPTVPTVVQPAPSSTTTTPTSTSTPPVNTTTTVEDHSGTTDGNTGSVPQPTGTTTPTTPNTRDDKPASTTTTVGAPSTKPYSTTGGKATIKFSGGRLTLVSYTPTAGYTADVRRNTATEIEIRFSNGDNESRIRVRVQDGQLRPEVED